MPSSIRFPDLFHGHIHHTAAICSSHSILPDIVYDCEGESYYQMLDTLYDHHDLKVVSKQVGRSLRQVADEIDLQLSQVGAKRFPLPLYDPDLVFF